MWSRSIVTAIISAILVLACIEFDRLSEAPPLAIGAVFVGLLNSGARPVNQIKSMTWCLGWTTLATLTGGLVATLSIGQIPFAMAAALLAGFAGALGKRGALIGILSMVLFIIFSGAPDSERTAITTAGYLALGGLVQLLIGGAVALAFNRQKFLTDQVGEISHSVVDRLKAHRTRADEFVRHALRLAVAVGVATAVAQSTGWPHEYWIPMTVVWVARPDRHGTTTRVVERILGTLLGVGIAFVFIHLIGTGTVLTTIYILISSFLFLAFINALYPLAVAGLTLSAVTLFSLEGDSLRETIPYITLGTLIAAVIMVAASYLWTYKPPVTDAVES
jgi:MFS family permease